MLVPCSRETPPLRGRPLHHSPEMVWIPGGEFLMGSDRHYPEEAPAHRVRVDGFWMDRFTVTNATSSASSPRPAT